MDIHLKEPIINMNDIYKFPSCDVPRSCISDSDSSNTLDTVNEFKSLTRKKCKKVKFNQSVTIINIQSFKNNKTKNDQNKKPSIFDEDCNHNKNQKQCDNCSIF